MKRFLTIMLVLILGIFLPNLGTAQDGTKTNLFYGIDFESNVGLRSGALFRISDKVGTIPYVRISLDTGSYDNGLQTSQSTGLELTYQLLSNEKYNLFLLGGVHANWTEFGVEKDLNTYITESAGLFGTWAIAPNTPLLGSLLTAPFGIWAGAKFKPQLFVGDTNWNDKFTVGIGLYSSI